MGFTTMVASLLTQPIEQTTLELREVWSTLTANSCPYDYNFHLHTIYSDGRLTPEALIEQAVSLGLKGLAITDHHSVGGYYLAQQWLAEFQSRHHQTAIPRLWTGIEITADLANTEVHILGYGFDPTHPALIPYLQGNRPTNGHESAALVIQLLHEAGGLVVLAHPARYRQPASRLIPLAVQLGIDGLETFYAYGNPKPWQSSLPQESEIKDFSDLYGLFQTCGTDSHGESILYRL